MYETRNLENSEKIVGRGSAAKELALNRNFELTVTK
jgi:hypothetical protein